MRYMYPYVIIMMLNLNTRVLLYMHDITDSNIS